MSKQGTPVDPTWASAADLKRLLGCDPGTFTRAALVGRVRTNLLPGQKPKFHVEDAKSLVAEIRARRSAKHKSA
jgi:hypothetical protein